MVLFLTTVADSIALRLLRRFTPRKDIGEVVIAREVTHGNLSRLCGGQGTPAPRFEIDLNTVLRSPGLNAGISFTAPPPPPNVRTRRQYLTELTEQRAATRASDGIRDAVKPASLPSIS